MSPRALGTDDLTVVWSNAWPARRSRWATCQYASRATSDAAITMNVISSSSIRRRESVRPSIRLSRFSRWSVGGRRRGLWPAQEHRVGQLAQTRVDRLATDRRLAAEPAQVGEQLLLALQQGVALLEHVVDVVAGRGDADRLGEREEREGEGDD